MSVNAVDAMSVGSSPLSSLSSSPLSSVASRSPTPSTNYPSPPSSHESENGSQKRLAEGAPSREDPPEKRRKVATPKELTTEYLNIRALNESSDDAFHKTEETKLRKLTEVLRSKRKIVVIAGAGISVSAGIPDFRSSTGLFSTLKNDHKLKASGKQLFDADVYRNNDSTASFHAMVREMSELTKKAVPTPFHHMLATLAEEGRLMRLYSQNVDGIEIGLKPLETTVPLNRKGPWPKTVQVHGGLQKMECNKCGQLYDFDGSLFDGPITPSCMECEERDGLRHLSGMRSHGIGCLRPRMVLYNEDNPDALAIGAVNLADIKNRPDAVIVVGTSLKVPGIRRLAKELCAVTRDRRGGFTAWVNLDQPPVGPDLKDCWDMVVQAECDDIARHVGLPQWDDKDCGEYRVVAGETAPKNLVGVVVESKPAVDIVQGIMTPIDSPRPLSPTPLTNMVKLKQTQIAPLPKYAGVTKSGKPKQKPGRKTQPKDGRTPLPNSKPKNPITNAFAMTKTKVATQKPQPPLTDVQSSKPAAAPSGPMRPISPYDSRTNADMPIMSPHTPVVEIASYNHRDTISPKGKLPTGMGNLID
ncbi:DHS-like NAD/FAD-binding domain-containing protein [Amylocarpus encephaloides]|uniref:DHS-like NAD/FAD-binding domain-containing protein n=1 Tax=Amylocarpus encephaloides TaxID=45428 RepID=A0A9P7YTD4_9HELO|nr:DHS-like NAD/FAD-binding domain-containing protein [Amylocarpus encephaloides]